MKELIIYTTQEGIKPFCKWLNSIDKSIRVRIDQRLARIEASENYGDHAILKNADNIVEIRCKLGSGYRIYLHEDENNIVILLTGGDKKTQVEDIEKAKSYWLDYLRSKKVVKIDE